MFAGPFSGTALAAGNAKSDYCEVARDWAVHELVPIDDTDPTVAEAYWGEYIAFVNDGERLAPKPIRDDWRIYAASSRSVTPVLEKYGYDLNLLFATATAEEQAVFEPGPAVQEAQRNVLRYESEVCGAQPPLPASVSFAGETPGHYSWKLRASTAPPWCGT
jgi:hypothetical protein